MTDEPPSTGPTLAGLVLAALVAALLLFWAHLVDPGGMTLPPGTGSITVWGDE